MFRQQFTIEIVQQTLFNDLFHFNHLCYHTRWQKECQVFLLDVFININDLFYIFSVKDQIFSQRVDNDVITTGCADGISHGKYNTAPVIALISLFKFHPVSKQRKEGFFCLFVILGRISPCPCSALKLFCPTFKSPLYLTGTSNLLFTSSFNTAFFFAAIFSSRSG